MLENMQNFMHVKFQVRITVRLSAIVRAVDIIHLYWPKTAIFRHKQGHLTHLTTNLHISHAYDVITI